jgi:uncharacterized protein (TIGR02147 family)
MASLKTIFEYDNYREFLRDYYMNAKARNPRFSYRVFARLGGFKSGNILKIVIDGKINILPETAEKFCKALKLNREESAFFKNLVLFNQSATSEERLQYSKELLRSRTYQKIHPLSEPQYRYFDRWYYPVVRGLVALGEFEEDPQWIAKRVSPSITLAEARQALEELLQLGLLSRDKTGRLMQSNPTVSTTNAIVSSSLAAYHREMMKRAAESIDRFPRELRDLSALTLGVSKQGVQVIRELAEKFRRDILEAAAKDAAVDSVYQLNIYFFPATGSGKKEVPK